MPAQSPTIPSIPSIPNAYVKTNHSISTQISYEFEMQILSVAWYPYTVAEPYYRTLLELYIALNDEELSILYGVPVQVRQFYFEATTT